MKEKTAQFLKVLKNEVNVFGKLNELDQSIIDELNLIVHNFAVNFEKQGEITPMPALLFSFDGMVNNGTGLFDYKLNTTAVYLYKCLPTIKSMFNLFSYISPFCETLNLSTKEIMSGKTYGEIETERFVSGLKTSRSVKEVYENSGAVSPYVPDESDRIVVECAF